MSKSRKQYYSIGQICEEFDLPASTIRFWEKRFSFLCPRKNPKGTRYYTSEDIATIKLIYHLVKEKKMTLSGVENHIMQHKVAAKSEMNVVEILQKIKSTLLEIKQEIETIEEERKKKKGENKAVVFKGSGEEGDSSQEEEDDNENSPFRQLELF